MIDEEAIRVCVRFAAEEAFRGLAHTPKVRLTRDLQLEVDGKAVGRVGGERRHKSYEDLTEAIFDQLWATRPPELR